MYIIFLEDRPQATLVKFFPQTFTKCSCPPAPNFSVLFYMKRLNLCNNQLFENTDFLSF